MDITVKYGRHGRAELLEIIAGLEKANASLEASAQASAAHAQLAGEDGEKRGRQIAREEMLGFLRAFGYPGLADYLENEGRS